MPRRIDQQYVRDTHIHKILLKMTPQQAADLAFIKEATGLTKVSFLRQAIEQTADRLRGQQAEQEKEGSA